jgi:hypothetical protein
MIVSSALRAPLQEMYPPDGKMPSLIADARSNPLTKRVTTEGDVLVKAPAMPYVEHHMLVLPDRIDLGPTPSVASVPEQLLEETFRTVGEVARHYQDDPEVVEINTGWNHSPKENLKHVATQQDTLHIHINGYTEADLAHTVSGEEVKQRPELRIKEREPLEGLITTILENEVFAQVATRPGFTDKYKRVEDGRRMTFEMLQGANAFADPELAATMQEIHTRAATAYEKVASCFFQQESDHPHAFIESEDNGNRFVLLPQDERVARTDAYIEEREYLTAPQREQLRFMARNSMSMEEVFTIFEARKGSELTDDEKYDRNPAMALKGLAYAAVMSGVRKEDGTFAWRFGFDPVVFAPRDVIQASRGTFSHFERQPGAVFSEEARGRMQADEVYLVQKLEATV